MFVHRVSSQKLVSSRIFPFPQLPHESISKSCSFYCTLFSTIFPLIQTIFISCLNDYNNLLTGHQASMVRLLESISRPLSISIFISKSISIQYFLFKYYVPGCLPFASKQICLIATQELLHLFLFSPRMLCLHSGYTGSFF